MKTTKSKKTVAQCHRMIMALEKAVETHQELADAYAENWLPMACEATRAKVADFKRRLEKSKHPNGGLPMTRTNYEMTEADLEKILDSCKPVPMIMLHIGGGPRSQQDRANDAWAELGTRMGFDAMTVEPRPGIGNRFFSAVPSENETQRAERVARETEEKRQREIGKLTSEIVEKQEKLSALRAAGGTAEKGHNNWREKAAPWRRWAGPIKLPSASPEESRQND